MADELRYENLFDTGADGTTAVNAGAEFRNDSSQILHIRSIDWAHILVTAENNETAFVEISKSPVFSSNTNNNVFYSLFQQLGITGGTTGAAVDDVATVANGGRKYGRGQLTLEPNESLFVNIAKTSGGTLNAHYMIAYHY